LTNRQSDNIDHNPVHNPVHNVLTRWTIDLSSTRTGNGVLKISIQESSFTKISAKGLLASRTLVQNDDLSADRVEAIATMRSQNAVSDVGAPKQNTIMELLGKIHGASRFVLSKRDCRTLKTPRGGHSRQFWVRKGGTITAKR
jgi:hypothetical protein